MPDPNGDLCPLAVFSGLDRKPIFQVKSQLNLVKPRLNLLKPWKLRTNLNDGWLNLDKPLKLAG